MVLEIGRSATDGHGACAQLNTVQKPRLSGNCPLHCSEALCGQRPLTGVVGSDPCLGLGLVTLEPAVL